MQKISSIKKQWAVALLVVCLLGALPKSYFHDVVANHTDTVTCLHPGEQTECVHPQGYHCGFTDLVVTAPYEPARHPVAVLEPAVYPVFSFAYTCALLSNAFAVTESRGPPSVA